MNIKINDEILAMCELSNDLLFHKIPNDKYQYYIQGSLVAGVNAALQYKGQDIRKLYRENHIKIEYCDGKNTYYGMEFRAQAVMSEGEKCVKIYKKSIDKFAEATELIDETLSYDLIIDIHLYHEFYHYLEYSANKSITEILDPVITMKIGPFIRRGHINRCSEISAHAFGKEMLGLKYLPNIYDYIYLINSGEMSQNDFDEMIQRYDKLLEQ